MFLRAAHGGALGLEAYADTAARGGDCVAQGGLRFGGPERPPILAVDLGKIIDLHQRLAIIAHEFELAFAGNQFDAIGRLPHHGFGDIAVDAVMCDCADVGQT